MKDSENDISFGAERFSFGFSFLLTKGLMDKITGSSLGQLIGSFLMFLLAAMFGIMFIIGSVGLFKGKKSAEPVVTTEVQEDWAAEEGESAETE